MFIKFLKKFVLSLFVVMTAFSSFPAYFLEQGLRVALNDYNVVDRIWLASSDKNVVDRLVPFQHVIDGLKVRTAEAAIVAGDGKIFYSIAANTTPRTRDYINSTNSFNVATATVVGGTAIQTEIKASPTQNEMIAGYVNAAGLLQVVCWNGAAWLNEWSVAVGGTGDTRRFDIAYETNSGDAMVMYSTNTATTNELAYRTKPGTSACGATSWSMATNLDPIRTTGIVHWVKMAWDRRASSNLITAIWADANADLSAMVWSGTAWGNEPTAALETALEIVAVGQDVESFDAEYESLSGDVMIVRGSGGTNGTNGGFYSTCTGGTAACTWTARTAMPTILDDVTHLDISANPNTDQILFGAIGNAGGDLSRGVWSGTAWTNTANADTSATTPLAGTKFVATGWLISGANTRGVLVYYDAATTNIGWHTLSGTTWTAQADFAVAPVFGVQKNYSIETDPINKDRLMLSVSDANSDVHAKRLVLTGTTFAWTNSAGGNPVEANTGSAVYETFDFAYNRFIPLPPVITTYTNTTETALNYSAACTTCGARIGGGAGFKQVITITGTNFGIVAPGWRTSATNNIKVGTHMIAENNITAWTPTSITFETDSTVVGDQDADWGTQYGGALALTVTANTLTGTGANFYVFPQVTNIVNCESLPSASAREYDAGDTVCPVSGLKDGEITLIGTRFGSSQGAGTVTVVSQSATPTLWNDTSILIQVPVAIVDTVNTGNISVSQGTGANGKAHTYAGQLRILPRIIDFTPVSAGEGSSVSVNGNHFCQDASCPLSFGASDKVTFTSAKDATVFAGWTASTISTQVPVGAMTGNVILTSNGGVNGVFTSNSEVFTVLTNTPSSPTALEQKDNNLTTISVGASASSTPIYFYFDTSSGVSGGTMFAQIETRPVLGPNSSFTSTCTANPYCSEGTGAVYAGGTINLSASSAFGDDIYHWQARTRYNNGGTDYFSGWTSFGGNPEGSTDFKIDMVSPVITNDIAGNIGTNTSTISWNTADEAATKRVEYNTTGTFTGGYDCGGTTECTALGDTSPMSNGHTVALVNLNSGTLYHYRVRSKDAAGNESVGTTKTFTTSSNLSPAKTIKSYIDGAIGVVSGATAYYFTATVPEVSPLIQNSYIEVLGVISGGVGSVAVQANGVASRSYDVSATNPTLYRLMYQIPSPGLETNLNLNDAPPCTNGALAGLPPETTPPCNSLTVTPSGVSMYVLSTKIITTYTYTP